MVSIRRLDERLRLAAATLIWILSLLAVARLLPTLGGRAIALLAVPPIVAGLTVGRWAGLVVGLATPPAQFLLLAWAGTESASGPVQPGLGFGPPILAGLGFLAGQVVRELELRRRAELVARTASDVLRIVASDRPLDETLLALTRRIERLLPEGNCSVLLLDAKTRTLHHGAAPSLPPEYVEAIDGVEIGPEVGSCGTAAATGRTVVVRDIREDPLWRDFRDLAELHRLRACWSVPIRSSDDRVLGTFAIYYPRPRSPRPFELEAVTEAASLAALAIEREAAHERRRELENQVHTSDRLEDIEILARGIAHDFNNLLTGVLGSADLLALELPNGAESRSHVERIRTAARQASDLADHLLLYAGRHSGTFVDVDLGTLATEVVAGIESSIPGGVRLELRCQEDLAGVDGDVAQLRQVCANLLINAADAIGDSPGTIEVALEARELDPDDLAHALLGDELEPGSFVELRVTDDGCGMDGETMRHIFAPFFSTKSSGRGVGLASTLGIVRLHRGALRVDSEPGKGSTFRVFLPVATRRRETSPQEREERMETTAFGGEALVVEDEEAVAEVVGAYLQRLGFESVAVGLGESALSLVRERPDRFRLVLIDLTLPDIPGNLVKSRMKDLGARACFVLTSGYDWETANLGEEEDAVFLHKPYDLADMRRTLELALAS